jgi:hypothetical protein
MVSVVRGQFQKSTEIHRFLEFLRGVAFAVQV